MRNGILTVMALAMPLMLGACADEEPEAEVIDQESLGEVQGAPGDFQTEPVRFTVVEIVAEPTRFAGQIFSSPVRVVEVPTDRGFWIEDQGERLFAVIIDQPQEQPMDIQPNTTVRITDATVRNPSDLGNLPGQPLDERTRSIAQNEQVFLTVDEQNIQPATGADSGTGTGAAAGDTMGGGS